VATPLAKIANHLINPPDMLNRAVVEEIVVVIFLLRLPPGKAVPLAQTLADSACALRHFGSLRLSSVQSRLDGP